MAPKNKYKCVFSDTMRETYPFAKKCKTSDNKFHCEVCNIKDVSLAYDGINDILRHRNKATCGQSSPKC